MGIFLRLAVDRKKILVPRWDQNLLCMPPFTHCLLVFLHELYFVNRQDGGKLAAVEIDLFYSVLIFIRRLIGTTRR